MQSTQPYYTPQTQIVYINMVVKTLKFSGEFVPGDVIHV